MEPTKKNRKKELHVLIILCLIPFPNFVSAPSPRSVIAVIDAIDKTVQMSETLFNYIKNEKNIPPEELVLSYLDVIPVVGNVVDLISGDIDANRLDQILNLLKTYSIQQEKIIDYLKDLHKKIDFIDVKVQITASVVDVDSCSTDRIHFLQHPKGRQERNALLRCSGQIMSDIRFLAHILKEDKYFPSLFKEIIIKSDGYCNYTKITNSFQYLHGITLGGCESVILAEKIEYNGTSVSVLEECKTLLIDVQLHLTDIFKTCTFDSCDTIKDTVKLIVQANIDQPLETLKQHLSYNFPWFLFAIFRFSKKTDVKLSGNRLPSAATFANESSQITVIWTPYETRVVPYGLGPPNSFTIQFNNEDYITSVIAINCTRNFETNPAVFNSYIVEDNKVSANACPQSTEGYQIGRSSSLRCRSLSFYMIVGTFLMLLIESCITH